MSGYDVAVCHGTVAMTQAQARSFYEHLTSDAVMFGHDPKVDAFLVNLRRRYPDRPPGTVSTPDDSAGKSPSNRVP